MRIAREWGLRGGVGGNCGVRRSGGVGGGVGPGVVRSPVNGVIG